MIKDNNDSLIITEGSFLINSIRKYGTTPYTIAVIHGGPGAAGEMAPVARELSAMCGTLEPLQTVNSIEGQIQELHTILKEHGDIPLTLIGHSWGAWLVFMFAARYPDFVGKLILVGSGPFEEKYALRIMETRISRLNEKEKLEVVNLIKNLNNRDMKNKDEIFAKFGKIMSKSDSFDPLTVHDEEIVFDASIHQNVWKEAEQLRPSGELLELGKKIQCPVVAIHGDYDPHPAEGIEKPLLQILKNFRFILLKDCGHRPWVERRVKEDFFRILRREISEN